MDMSADMPKHFLQSRFGFNFETNYTVCGRYGVFKIANEGTARIYAQDHGLRSIGLRPLTCFGVGREVQTLVSICHLR